MIQLCLKEYLSFHIYLNMTFVFTKVQNISMEFANARVKRNWCTPYLISRKLGAPSSVRHCSQHFIQQRQTIDTIDPYQIQPIILRIYHGYGDGQSFLSCAAPFQNFLTNHDNSLQLCALRIMISQIKSRARKREC